MKQDAADSGPAPDAGVDTSWVGTDAATSVDTALDGDARRIEPLALCARYFPDAMPMLYTAEVAKSFWFKARDDCATAGLFETVDKHGMTDYLNYVSDWSLLLIGCEPSEDFSGSLDVFGLARQGVALAQTDIDRMVDHFMAALRRWVPLDEADAAAVRAVLIQSSQNAVRCDCSEPQLERCEKPTDARADATPSSDACLGEKSDGSC